MDDNEFDLKVAALKQLLTTAEKGYEIAPPETKKLLLKEFEELQTQMAELVKAKMESMEIPPEANQDQEISTEDH